MQSCCSPIHVRFSCWSPIASSSDAALRLRPLQLLLATCVCFKPSIAPRLRPFRLRLPDCNHFNCCSLIASTSTAAPRLHPLQLLLPYCVRFNCCSPIATTSTAAPLLRPFQLLLPDHILFDCCSLPSACSPSCSGRLQPMPWPMLNILRRVRGSSTKVAHH